MHEKLANTHARVNLFKMSIYKSCWRWSDSQFSTCMNLLRHGCQRNSFWNPQTDSQMYTFPDQMNWQFVQMFRDSKFRSKLRVLRTQMRWRKRFLCFLFGENLLGIVSWCLFSCFKSSVSPGSVSGTQNKCPNSHHNPPRYPFITWIYRECKVQNGLIL